MLLGLSKSKSARSNRNHFGRTSGLARTTAATWIITIDGIETARLFKRHNSWIVCSLDCKETFGGRAKKIDLINAIKLGAVPLK